MSAISGAAERNHGGASGTPGRTSRADAEASRAAAASGLERLVREKLGLEPGRLEVGVGTGGRQGEIAVVRIPAHLLGGLLRPGVRAELVEAARAAGFRHAAVDLDFAAALPPRPGG